MVGNHKMLHSVQDLPFDKVVRVAKHVVHVILRDIVKLEEPNNEKIEKFLNWAVVNKRLENGGWVSVRDFVGLMIEYSEIEA